MKSGNCSLVVLGKKSWRARLPRVSQPLPGKVGVFEPPRAVSQNRFDGSSDPLVSIASFTFDNVMERTPVYEAPASLDMASPGQMIDLGLWVSIAFPGFMFISSRVQCQTAPASLAIAPSVDPRVFEAH